MYLLSTNRYTTRILTSMYMLRIKYMCCVGEYTCCVAYQIHVLHNTYSHQYVFDTQHVYSRNLMLIVAQKYTHTQSVYNLSAPRIMTQKISRTTRIQGGEDAQDALSCRSFFAREPLIIGLFCVNWPMKIRHPMTLRHPVLNSMYLIHNVYIQEM